MTRAELRRQMRERKKTLRAELSRRRAEARAQVEQLPAVRKAKLRRRIRRSAVLMALLLLALFVRCDCADAVSPAAAPPAEVKAPELPAPAKAPPAVPVKVPVEPLKGKVPSQPRGTLHSEARPAPSWLEAFHLQVSARSPRLAECFTGADRPGALRWAASLNAKSGTVSDHELEPLGVSADIDSKQRECLIRVLSNPPYRLKLAEGEPLPNRVGLVIEF